MCVSKAQEAIRAEFGSPPLTIELVPRTTWGLNLWSLLRTCDWDRLRKPTYAAAGGRCEICGGVGRQHAVECHELWRFVDDTCIQRLVGLRALCPTCHAAKHFGRAEAKGFGGEIREHITLTNSWSRRQTQRYIELEYALWSVRSRREWDLDLSWLAPFKIRPNPSAWLRSCRRAGLAEW
jgi:hypothetical protein